MRTSAASLTVFSEAKWEAKRFSLTAFQTHPMVPLRAVNKATEMTWAFTWAFPCALTPWALKKAFCYILVGIKCAKGVFYEDDYAHTKKNLTPVKPVTAHRDRLTENPMLINNVHWINDEVTESLAKHNSKKIQVNLWLPHLYAFCLRTSIMFCTGEIILTVCSTSFCNDLEFHRSRMIC